MKHIETVEELNALRKDGAVLVDFYAKWCGPCKQLGKKLPALQEEYKNVTFVKVNIEEGEELAEVFKVSSIPLVLIWPEDSEDAIDVKGFNLKAIKEALDKTKDE
jgi:thioredoxin 1